MTKYNPYEESAEVRLEAVGAFVNAFLVGEQSRIEILKKHGIDLENPQEWYPQAWMLDAIEEVEDLYGDRMVENIGQNIPQYAIFPEEVNDLESALESIDVAYKMNHRNGAIGYYELLEFDTDNRIAVMKCENPYPSMFDLGLLKAILTKFLPKDSFVYDVILDKNRPTRLKGATSCTYILNW